MCLKTMVVVCFPFSVDAVFSLARTRLEEAGQAGFDADIVLTVTWENTIPAEAFDENLDGVSV